LSIHVHKIENALELGLKEAIIGFQESVIILLSSYTDCYNPCNMFLIAAESNNLEACKLFQKYGADNIDVALSAASSRGHLRIVQYLIEECAGYPTMALSKAMEAGRAEIVIYLYRYHHSKLSQ
jgi:hypothetical protein